MSFISLAYASHLSALMKAISLTSGDVLELGMGIYSTPVLHHLCMSAKRNLVSYDNNRKWTNWAKKYGYDGRYHRIVHVKEWGDAKIEKPWDVVLVDHSPSIRRKEEIKRLAKYGKYIIIHDSDRRKDKEYRYSEIYPLFKCRTNWTDDNTTILSNFVDLIDFRKEKMNDTLKYIIKKFDVVIDRKPPIEIFNGSREDMAKVIGELGFKKGAEIGVAQGIHAEMLCKNNPGLRLYCIDIWGRYDGYLEYTNRIERYYKEARDRLRPYECVFVKKFSMDAVKDFKDGSLDFVYIDGAHDFRSVADDISEWAKKVRVGGIVYGHDYKRRRKGEKKYIVEVKDVVQAYCYAKAIDPWFVLKIPRYDTSWMFVRQEGDLI